MNKKSVFLWTLYDFANSIVVFVFFLYFSQWLVVENKVADIWYNLIFSGSSFLLILTAPVFGIIADKRGVKMPYLRILTVLFFIFTLLTSIFAIFASADKFHLVILSAIAYLFANYFYQFSFAFYNPLLNDIAPPGKQGLVSGLGQAANWLGGIAGIVLALTLLNGSWSFLNISGRADTFLPATIIFFVLALPMLFLFKETPKPSGIKINLKNEYKNIFRSFIELCKKPGVGRYLLAFFFFNDAILTAQNNFPIFMEQVFKVPDKTKSILLGSILITSVMK